VNTARLLQKGYAIRHKSYIRALSAVVPYYLVNEYPKSGGTWLAQMLADSLDLPFRRNVPIQVEKSVTHGHFFSKFGLRNVVLLWRDPRDVLVSFYYHCFFLNEHQNYLLVNMMKNQLPFEDYHDVKGNLPRFIRFLSCSPVSPKFSWPEFVFKWHECPYAVQTNYESLRSDPSREITRVVEALTGEQLPNSRALEVVDKNSFERAKLSALENKSKDTEMSFVRKGSVGGWRPHFSNEAMDTLKEFEYDTAMHKLGYKY